MARAPRSVGEAIARFDEYSARLDGHIPMASAASRRALKRSAGTMARRVAFAAAAIFLMLAGTALFSQLIAPIGAMGFLALVVALVFLAGFILLRPTHEPKRVAYSDELPTKMVVQQLDNLLHQRRTALPAPAARRVDAISKQLPLLESRLGEVDALDPLAQDARRLMGKHLPELIERYERVPAPYRTERDGEGLSVDERLVASLDAAHQALGELGGKLAKQDMDAFETQGRFIESRYKDGAELKGD